MRTWDNLEEMRRGMMLMLQGNPYFAWQYVKGDKAPYYPCRDLTQLSRFENEIFEGDKTPGFYAIRPDEMTGWGSIDFDFHGLVGNGRWRDKAEWAFSKLSTKFRESWLIESSPGCFHVIFYAGELILARDMRRILGEFAPPEVEVFPKQDTLKDEKNAKGSLLRFPGKHQLKGTWGKFIARSGKLEGVQIKPWKAPCHEEHLESLYVVATRGVVLTGQGQRFNAMQRIVGRLKGRATLEEATWVHQVWYNRNKDKILTSFPESQFEFLNWYNKAKPCNPHVPEYSLTPEEEHRIAALQGSPNIRTETLQQVGRMFFWAKKHAEKRGLSECFLSCRDIAKKINLSIATAARYRTACEVAGLIHLSKRGYTGHASTYTLNE